MVTLSSSALTKKSTSVIILLIGAVLTLSLFVDTCDASNTTNTEAESMEKGMDFLFQMTRGFLGIIQPNRIYEKYDLQKMTNDGVYREETMKNWQQLTLYFIGFAVCAAIGIVFIIVMPIIGCCLCCCRTCCNKCGGKPRKHDPKNARYKRGCYATFLTIFNTFILFAVVCTFVTNEIYKKRFIDDPEIFNIAKRGTQNLKIYVDQSFDDLKTVAKRQVSLLETDLLTQLKNAGNKSVAILGKDINVTVVMKEVEDLGKGVIKLKTSISQLSQSLKDLTSIGSKLEADLTLVKKAVITKLNNCKLSECLQITDYINGTNVNAQFSTLDKQTVLLTKLSKVLDIPDLAKEAKKKFDSVSKNITDAINKQNNTIVDGFTKISNEIDTSLNNITELKKVIPTNKIDEQLNRALDSYNSNKKYSSIPWYVGLCVASILLLIVVCNYLGILFGLCGERAGENTPCCNRGVAANFLLTGVGFYFLFCWILVLLVLIEFVFGGVIYTEFCRYLKKDDPTQMQPILLQFNFTYKVFDKDVPLVTYDVVDKCYKNHSLLKSINFPKSILKDKIPTTTLVNKIKDIAKDNISIGEVTLLDSTLEKKLTDFKNLNTNSINITQYEIEKIKLQSSVVKGTDIRSGSSILSYAKLNKTVVTTDLNVIAYNLTTLSTLVNISFDKETQKLREIQSTTYNSMKNEMNNLGQILVGVKKNMNLDQKVASLISTVKDVEQSVKINGTKLIHKIVDDEILELVKIVNKNVDILINTVINEVAPCKPVYDIIFTFTDIVCVMFLNPMNGFWFSTGWAIFFFLPTIIFATKLAGLYRCWYKRDPTQENADSYVAGDADNIPLARVNQGKSSPQGMPNGAYDEMPSNKYHPPSHPYNYGGPGHHYSGYPVYPPPSYHDTRMNPGRY